MNWWRDAIPPERTYQPTINLPPTRPDRVIDGVTYIPVLDPESREIKYYMKKGDYKTYYLPQNDGSLFAMSQDDYDKYTIYRERQRRKYEPAVSPKEFMAGTGGKKKRRSTKSRPRRSTRSRKVTLRRR